MKEIGQRELVALHELGPSRIEESEAASRHNYRHASEEAVIDYLRLRHVGELGRSTDVGDRRKNVVLHDGAQQSVRRKTIRQRREIRGGHADVAPNVVAILSLQRDPTALLE